MGKANPSKCSVIRSKRGQTTFVCPCYITAFTLQIIGKVIWNFTIIITVVWCFSPKGPSRMSSVGPFQTCTVTAFSLFLAFITSVASWRWLCTCAALCRSIFSPRQTCSQPKSEYSLLTITFRHCWRWASMIFQFGLALQPLLGQSISRSEHSSHWSELM